MKKILFMAVSAALLAAGCQKTEVQNEARTPIGFSSHMGKLTKSPDAGNEGRYDNLIEQDFRVWGYFATANDINYDLYDNYLGPDKKDLKGAIDVIVTEQIDNETSSPICNTGDETYYWPGKNKELDLYAVSLWNTQTATPSNTYNKVDIYPSAKTLKIKDFEVNAAADDDLMVAPLIRQDQDDSKYVEPEFKHALTKVLVTFKTAMDEGDPTQVSVVSAHLTNVKSKGTLTVVNTLNTVASGATTSEATFTWSEVTNPLQYDDEYPDSEKAPVEATEVGGTTSEQHQAVPLVNGAESITFGSWLFIPQESTGEGEELVEGIANVDLVVNYIVDGVYVSQTFDLTAGDGAVKEWRRNMQTTYKVTISPDYILFEPDVTDWDEEKTNDENRGDYEPQA